MLRTGAKKRDYFGNRAFSLHRTGYGEDVVFSVVVLSVVVPLSVVGAVVPLVVAPEVVAPEVVVLLVVVRDDSTRGAGATIVVRVSVRGAGTTTVVGADVVGAASRLMIVVEDGDVTTSVGRFNRKYANAAPPKTKTAIAMVSAELLLARASGSYAMMFSCYFVDVGNARKLQELCLWHLNIN